MVCNGLGMSDQNFDKGEEKIFEGRMIRAREGQRRK
jgi:hypothetical protein